MVVSGVPTPRHDHAQALVDAALEMLAFVRNWPSPHAARIRHRIGINSGAIMAGVIGRAKFSYDVWGDPVNVASRMAVSYTHLDVYKRQLFYRELVARFADLPAIKWNLGEESVYLSLIHISLPRAARSGSSISTTAA